MKAAGGFVDLMQWRTYRSNPVGMADDGYVLEYRLFDSGKGPFSWNVDRKTMTPKYMFAPEKTGVKALTVDDIGDPSKPYAVIREENAIPYDPDARWKEGDILSGRLLSREDATGSAADNSRVHGEWKDGVWTVVWTRKLDTGHPGDDKVLKEGGRYTVGLAVHDDNVTTRFHFVGFPVTLGIGTAADIEAVKDGVDATTYASTRPVGRAACQCPIKTAADPEEVARIAAELATTLVLKILSSVILHKSDCPSPGILGIKNVR